MVQFLSAAVVHHHRALDNVWDEEIVPLLRGDLRGKLQATAVLEWLDERHPGRFSTSHLRTLQRMPPCMVSHYLPNATHRYIRTHCIILRVRLIYR